MNAAKVLGIVTLALTGLSAVVIGLDVVESSTPATPLEIQQAIASADPSCRQLVRHRISVTIADKGAVSKRSLDAKVHGECATAGPQFAALMKSR